MSAPPGTDRPSPLRLAAVLHALPGASNTTVLALDGDGTRWVYKPAAGEEPLWDFPWRTLAVREVLAYAVSEALGFGIVPETRPATGPLGPGSAQRFVDEDRRFDPRPLLAGEVESVELWQVAALDIVTNNADRKAGHLLREAATGRLQAIDNGLTFHPQPKLRTVLWTLAGRPLPDEIVAGVGRLAAALDAGLCDRVAADLSPGEGESLLTRAEALLRHPFHPLPPTDRPPIPWPPW